MKWYLEKISFEVNKGGVNKNRTDRKQLTFGISPGIFTIDTVLVTRHYGVGGH